jgi:hypothetical protein
VFAGEGIFATLVDIIMIGARFDTLLYGIDSGTDIIVQFEHFYDADLSSQVFDDILQGAHND